MASGTEICIFTFTFTTTFVHPVLLRPRWLFNNPSPPNSRRYKASTISLINSPWLTTATWEGTGPVVFKIYGNKSSSITRSARADKSFLLSPPGKRSPRLEWFVDVPELQFSSPNVAPEYDFLDQDFPSALPKCCSRNRRDFMCGGWGPGWWVKITSAVVAARSRVEDSIAVKCTPLSENHLPKAVACCGVNQYLWDYGNR